MFAKNNELPYQNNTTTYQMNFIPETCRAHLSRYLRFITMNILTEF